MAFQDNYFPVVPRHQVLSLLSSKNMRESCCIIHKVWQKEEFNSGSPSHCNTTLGSRVCSTQAQYLRIGENQVRRSTKLEIEAQDIHDDPKWKASCAHFMHDSGGFDDTGAQDSNRIIISMASSTNIIVSIPFLPSIRRISEGRT